MAQTSDATRKMSSAIFNNEKFVEVVVALDAMTDGIGTAQHVSTATDIGHNLVRSVLRRLVDAGVLSEVPRVGSSRSPLYYAVNYSSEWRQLVALCLEIRGRRSLIRDSTRT